MTPADRAEHLLAGLTLAEKVAMLHQWCPAVDRLGLPTFRTGAEVLHGVAWLGEATVFPQPVGLAATWDPELLERIGTAVAAELHAKRAADPSISLNVWAPVVDPLRHPRWGRNEEGLSEDPHLVSDLATGYARGLRGSHADRWRTIPTLKHLLAYNVEEDRDVRSMQVRDRVLHEYELPAFTGPLRAGVAGAVMPAYNLVNGRPAHTSGELIDEVRAHAPEEILVVSDAGAPSNLVASQHRYPDAVHAHAAALRAGIDSFTDNDANPGPTTVALHGALEQGLITEADVDRAARRVLLTRIRALDAAEEPSRALDDLLRDHAVLAREAAARSVVVLRGEVASIAPAPSRVAVVGPLGDRVLPDWYAGVPRFTSSIAAAAAERWPDAEVRVVDGSDHVALQLADGRYLATKDDGALVPGAGRGLAVRLAVTDWGWGLLTIADLATERLWSADSRGFVRATAERPHGWVVQESFRICTAADGLIAFQHVGSGRWLRLDAAERLVAAARTQQEATWFVRHTLGSGTAAAAEAAVGADLVLCALGNDPHLLGRETEDRPELELPPSQVMLWEAVHESAPEAVLTLVSSYPYAFELEARTVLWTAHSQAVGHGVIDIVSGDVAPSGRLPQTWWRSSSDAGDLADYDIITGRSTYWYSDTEPLFAFGHGLTGSHVEYLSLDVVASDPEAVTVAVTIRNHGPASATEVVQVYTDALDHRVPFPHRLGGYARVAVSAGEERHVSIRVPRDRFSFWDTARAAMTVDPGRYRLSAGPSASDSRASATVDLHGPAPEPHRLPVRAASFDDLARIRLVDETPERGTAVAGPGWAVLDDVEGLRGSIAVRVARDAPGQATVDLSTREGTSWRTFATATVPEGIGRYDWTDVTTTPNAPPPPPRGPLRITLTGPVRLVSLG